MKRLIRKFNEYTCAHYVCQKLYLNNELLVYKYIFFQYHIVRLDVFRLNLQMNLKYNGLLLADNQYTPLEEHINFF